MERRTARRVGRLIAVTGVIALFGGGAATPGDARIAQGPRVEIQFGAGLAPDGRSIGVQVLASCPERWTVVEAAVTLTQPQATGTASFPLTCIGSLRSFWISVPYSGNAFELGQAHATASVVVKRGKTESAQDSQALTVQPTVLVELADTARLEAGGAGAEIAVTVACPVGTNGLESRLNISQSGRTSGNGTYTPICDGTRHTFDVHVRASEGVYLPGEAVALTFADIEFQGEIFYGVDDGPIQLVN